MKKGEAGAAGRREGSGGAGVTRDKKNNASFSLHPTHDDGDLENLLGQLREGQLVGLVGVGGLKKKGKTREERR